MKVYVAMVTMDTSGGGRVLKAFDSREKGIAWLKAIQKNYGGTFTDVTCLYVPKMGASKSFAGYNTSYWLETLEVE